MTEYIFVFSNQRQFYLGHQPLSVIWKDKRNTTNTYRLQQKDSGSADQATDGNPLVFPVTKREWRACPYWLCGGAEQHWADRVPGPSNTHHISLTLLSLTVSLPFILSPHGPSIKYQLGFWEVEKSMSQALPLNTTDFPIHFTISCRSFEKTSSMILAQCESTHE